VADIDDDQRRLEFNRRREGLPTDAERERFVRAQARVIHSRAHWITTDDLMQEGRLAWEHAKAKYPETAHTSGFKAFAATAARRAMLAEANRTIPRALLRRYVAIYYAERDLMAEPGRRAPPTIEEIARKAGLTLADVEWARRAWTILFPDQPPEHEPGSSEDNDESNSLLETARPEIPQDPRPSTLSPDIDEAFSRLDEATQDAINRSWQPDEETTDPEPSTSAERKAAFDAKQRFFNETVRVIAERAMSDGERAQFVSRYRHGCHRLSPEPSYYEGYRKFRARLREADLLRRIYPDDVLDAVTRRYIRRHAIEDIVAAKRITLNRYLADEFTYTQPLVAALEVIRRRDEFQHAILPDQLSSVRCFARDGDVRAVAGARGLPVDTIEHHLQDAMETATWMAIRHRYLKIANPPVMTKPERERLVQVYCDRKSPTVDDTLVQAVALGIFGLEEQVRT
jgi:DNA-directed RNA polymerase specialized sigma subunit